MTQGEDPDAVELLSRDRLDGFRDELSDSDKLLVGRYLLNAAASEALIPHLHALEVILRNRISIAGSKIHPIDIDRPDLYQSYPTWIDATPSKLIQSHQEAVESARKQINTSLRRRYGPSEGSAKRLRTPGRLVAALPFSFWVFLFDTEYSGDRASPGILWPDLFSSVFPYADDLTLASARKRLRRLLVVRNRIMHHERILPYREGSTRSWNPSEIRDDIVGLVGAMSPRAAALLQRVDRVPDVIHPVTVRYLRLAPWRM